MPKARQTCTRCSMRRQKCDKQQPCSRCISAGEAHCCTRVWVGGYDASVHRQYPKSHTKHRRRSSAALSPSSDNDAVSHHHQHEGSLQLPSLDSDSDSWSSEHERKSLSSGGVEYAASIEDFLWSPDPLHRAMITENSPTVFHGQSYAAQQTDPRLLSPSLAQDDQKSTPRDHGASYLEGCLPNGLQILQLVDYHEENILWFTHCYHGPTFRQELTQLLHAGGGRLSIKGLDPRWCALLFAILTSSLCCASESAVRKWGFTSEQRMSVSRRWHDASMECLEKGEYTSRPHPYSVQAILVLIAPSQILGLSRRHCLVLGDALKIAQNLGLHRLPSQSEAGMSPVSEEAAISTEVGRRIWWALVAHDWMSIASYDMFSIDSTQFTTPRPQSYETPSSKGPDRLADIHNHILDIATIMMEFHVASTASTNTASEYEQVWKHDQQLRELSRKDRNLEDLTLPWGFWARSLLRTKLAHKIIEIHRNFFDRSFRDSTYAWSRWASVEAAKTIIHEAETAFEDPERPVIWTEQSHLVVAGVVLGKDIARRAEGSEREEHIRLLQKAMSLLARHEDSALANRGHRILSSFLAESAPNTPDPSWSQMSGSTRLPTPDAMFDVSRFVAPRTTMCPSPMPLDPALAGSNPPTFTTAPGAFDVPSISVDPVTSDATWADMMPAFPQERLGVGNMLGFDDPYDGF